MELINNTSMQAAYTMGMDPSGRECLVVAVKGTFGIPVGAERPRLAEEQMPLVMADTFSGEPGLSAPVYEADFAPAKGRCDVVLNGTAYAPGGRPVPRVTVGMKIGTLQKAFDVIGDRTWIAGRLGARPSEPQPFRSKPISYDVAFGGKDDFHEDEAHHAAYMPNPIGRGYHKELASQFVDGSPLPNTEERGKGITDPKGSYRPMAFGPIGRGWLPRFQFAGTYDDDWLDNGFPFLPADFQEAYHQCTLADQQLELLRGGEDVVLLNLTPEGRCSFRLPSIEVPMVFLPRKGGRHDVQAQADTLVIEPNARRFMVTWRASFPLKRNMFEVGQILVGTMPRIWWRAREDGIPYYRKLGDAVKACVEGAEQ